MDFMLVKFFECAACRLRSGGMISVSTVPKTRAQHRARFATTSPVSRGSKREESDHLHFTKTHLRNYIHNFTSISICLQFKDIT